MLRIITLLLAIATTIKTAIDVKYLIDVSYSYTEINFLIINQIGTLLVDLLLVIFFCLLVKRQISQPNKNVSPIEMSDSDDEQSQPGSWVKRAFTKNNMQSTVSVTAIVISTVSILLQFDIINQLKLDFTTPEDAIKTTAKLQQDGSYSDMRRARRIFEDEIDWRYVDPSSIKIEKVIEVKNTGNSSSVSGALCFIKHNNEDGITIHKAVITLKDKNGNFSVSSYIRKPVEDEFGEMIKKWEKTGTF